MKQQPVVMLMLAAWALVGATAPGPTSAPQATALANAPLPADAPPAASLTSPEVNSKIRDTLTTTGPTIALFALASLVPAAVLMVTSFVRISIVLTLLRQALGNPQVPGNQVLTALALLLTALVMRPVADTVYTRAIEPLSRGEMSYLQAWEAGSAPIKEFMIRQIFRTGHRDYLWKLYDYVEPPTPGRADPSVAEEFPLRVVAPAYLLSELTTALLIGFAIYLPFLVIDLVVSAVLAAMGLILLPPALVAMPLKLALFVLVDGWMLVSGMLLRSFS